MAQLAKNIEDATKRYKRWFDRISPTSRKILRKKSCLPHPLPELYVKDASTIHLKRQPFFGLLSGELLKLAQHGLDRGCQPKACPDGTGGVYFLRGKEGEFIAVFKPRDEEIMCPNNPKGYRLENGVIGVTENPQHSGFLLGDGARREHAAYLLDASYGGFHRVPQTTQAYLQVEAGGPFKEGSLQAFVQSSISAEDIGSGLFVTDDIQRIGLLDIRLCNTDRHAANILLVETDKNKQERQGKYSMIPVDHGLCLPRWQHLEAIRFEWLNWKQSKEPFQKQHLEFIDALDLAKDAKTLRMLHFDEDAITTMKLGTLLLKRCAREGMTLYDIGSLMQREGDGEYPSTMEKMVSAALERVRIDLPDLVHGSHLFYDSLILYFEMELKKFLAETSHTVDPATTAA